MFQFRTKMQPSTQRIQEHHHQTQRKTHFFMACGRSSCLPFRRIFNLQPVFRWNGVGVGNSCCICNYIFIFLRPDYINSKKFCRKICCFCCFCCYCCNSNKADKPFCPLYYRKHPFACYSLFAFLNNGNYTLWQSVGIYEKETPSNLNSAICISQTNDYCERG